jgi:Methyltransferase domain
MAKPMPAKTRSYTMDSRHLLPAFRDAIALAYQGAVHRKNRKYVIDIGRAIRSAAFNMNDRMPVIDLKDLSSYLGCTEEKEIVLPSVGLIHGAGLGYVGPYALLATITSALQPKKILETGTFRGLGTLTMALNAPNAEIYTVDLPDEVGGEEAATLSRGDKEWVRLSQGLKGAAFVGHPAEARIHQIKADSLKMDVREFIDIADFCFIDGGHSYECIKADTENALKVLSPNGVIVWDDYNWFLEGVTGYLSELARQLPLKRIFGSQFVIYRREG